MSLNTQIQTIIISFLYGIFFSITMNLSHKFIYNQKKLIKIIFTLIFIFIYFLIYFYILLKINYGIIHIYGILVIIIGFTLHEIIKNNIVKIYKKHKQWYNLYEGKVNMKKKKISKASKRRLLLFGTISLVVIVYFFSILFSYTYNIYKLKQEEKQLQTELATLEHNEKLLKINIEKLKDPEYIAKYAREYFQYSKDGEIILKIDSLNNKLDETKKDFEYDVILKLGCGILFVIILYVFIKNRK